MNSIPLDLILKLFTALALGALIGAEREMKKAKEDPKSASLAGLRTHVLMSLIGFSGALLSQNYGLSIVAVLLGAVSLLFFGAYVIEIHKGNRFGLAGELSGLVTFLVGVMSLQRPLLASVLTIATVLVLILKDPLHHFVRSLSPVEFLSAIKFIIVTFVILPILPQTPIDPWGLIIPFHAWLMVVLVSAISFVGYILVKALGSKQAIGWTALLGGLASSTATTTSLAQQGRHSKRLAIALTFGVIVTSTMMLIRVMIEVMVVNASLVPKLALTLGSMVGVSLIILVVLGFKMRQKRRTPKADELELSSPFRLWPALQFGLLYVATLLIAALGNRYLGEGGVYMVSVTSGLASVDAIALSLSHLALENKLAASTAVNGITLAVMTNTVVKIGLVKVFGSKEMFRWTALTLSIVIAVGLGAILLG